MEAERWQKVKSLFDAALRLAPEKRGKFLDESCVEDKILRGEVENLLASFKDDSFMEQPAATELASLIVERNRQLKDGEQIAHYRILSHIGAGGMGEVYLAQDARLHRKIALKILPAALSGDRDRLRRFEQEACAASALNHPNILTIYEIGETAGTRYIATEFIDGETLRDKLQRDDTNLKEILGVAEQTAFALCAAHAAGIIHRDIKPENIMLRTDGIVKVLDFGLAKLTEKKETDSDSEAETRAQVNTQAGMILGTVAYMSPEQARGKETDVRTDIWSFGVVLYEMLAGKVPFAGETTSDTIAAILKNEPAPLGENTPPELNRIIRKTLQKNVDERYQTVKDLLLDLKNLKREVEFSEEIERSHTPSFAKSANVAATQPSENATAIQPAVSTQNSISPQPSSAEYVVGEVKKHKFVSLVLLAALLVALAAIGYFRFFAERSEVINSIAVLPFVNESGNADVEYLSDGMTETLISSLSQLPKLNVKARSSVFRYKGTNTDLQQIARELNVQAILNGRVVQRGQDLSLYVELVDVAADKVIWSQTYNRRMTNLVSLQSEIARDVSTNLQTKLSGTDERKLAKNYTENAEAYQLYLKGLYKWNKHTQKDLQEGIEYFYQAIELDPNYALAYTGLANSYGILGMSYLPPNEAFPKAKAYAAKALAIDETLAEAHSSMGGVRLNYDWNWAEAEKELKRALALNPNYTDAHVLYSAYLDAMGRFNEARAEAKRGQELDPLSPLINMGFGITFYHARQYDEAIAQFEKTINLEPHFYPAYLWLGQAYEQKKMYAQAIETFQKGMAQAERHPMLIAALGHAYALAGERDKAQQALNELREMSKQRYVSPYLFAVIYVGLGDKDQTFVWLEKAFQDRSFFLIWLKVEPQFDPLRDDSRLQDLLRRGGLPQ